MDGLDADALDTLSRALNQIRKVALEINESMQRKEARAKVATLAQRLVLVIRDFLSSQCCNFIFRHADTNAGIVGT